MIKRLCDIIFSLVGLIITAPFLLALILAIRLGSQGPAFYRGLRVGKNGKNFKIFKFRTMVINADKIGGPSTSDDDPRITKVGHFIRKYKLDELAQLMNVLKGEMSIVGPRPEVPQEVDLYTVEEKRLLEVRPGITDYASIRFHNEGAILKGAVDPHQAYLKLIRPDKIRLGLEYVKNPTLINYFKIIYLTFRILINSRLAACPKSEQTN